MKLVLLASNSLHNKGWITEMAQNFTRLFDECYVHEYEHWQKGQGMINFDRELQRLKGLLEGQKYVIFAKSAGVALAMKGIHEGVLKPKMCLFVSTPIFWAEEHGIPLRNWFEDYSTPTFFIQKTKDPVIGSKQLKEKLSAFNLKNCKFRSIEGEGRDYEDAQYLTKEMHELIDKK